MVNQMLLELLCKFGTKSLYVIYLFGDLLANLENFFVYIPTKEVGPLSRVVGTVFDILHQLL